MGSARKELNFECRNVYEVRELSSTIASYLPDPDAYMIGIYELLMNAIEHGNLEIGYELKTELLHKNLWGHEVMRRMQQPRYNKRFVSVDLHIHENEYIIHIKDQGEGFNWRHYLHHHVEPQAFHGHGLLMVRHCPFDEISFNEKGNEVYCKIQRH